MDRLLSCCCPFSFFGRGQGLQERLLLGNEIREIYGVSLNSEKYALLESSNFYEYKWLKMQHESIGGWKIHIALSNDIDQVTLAWKLILPILIEYNIGNFKIAKEPFLSIATEGTEQGKVVTIYLAYNPELCVNGDRHGLLQKMISKICFLLNANNICAGNRSITDRQINGSPYFSYRCDAGNRPGEREGTLLPIDVNEARILSEQNGYNFEFMAHFTTEDQLEQPDKGRIYICVADNRIKYQVINLNGI